MIFHNKDISMRIKHILESEKNSFNKNKYILSHVCNGKDSSIYRVDNKAIKIYKPHISSKKIAIQDYTNLKTLYENGRPFPKPIGAFEFNLEGQDKSSPGIAMNFIEGGINLREISDKGLKKQLRNLKQEELKICEDLGFKIWDDVDANALWVPAEEKLYLLDVTNWSFKSTN